MSGGEEAAVSSGEARRVEILEQSARLFAEQGVAMSSMADIAAAVGIQKASLYYFVDSKETLLGAVLKPVVERPYRELEAIVRTEATVSRRVRTAMEALGRVFEEERPRMEILVRERLERLLSPGDHALIQRWRRAYTDLWRDLLREGVANGEFRDVDITVTAFGIIGSLNWMYAWFGADGRLSGGAVGNALADVVLAGLEAS